MHYHVGAYSGDRLIDSSGITYRRDRAEDWRETKAYAQAVWNEHELSAADYRGLVIDDIDDPDYTDRIRQPVTLHYDYRVLECSLPVGRCVAAYEAVQQRARARDR